MDLLEEWFPIDVTGNLDAETLQPCRRDVHLNGAARAIGASEISTYARDIFRLLYPVGVRALGIDYGKRRIGLALSDATGMLARPWKTIAREGGPDRVAATIAREIAALRAEEDGLRVVVLGLPRRLSGEANEMTAAVHALAEQLRATAGEVPVVLQDERLTSHEAESLLARREKDWRKRKPLVDSTAAALILQDYLDAQADTTSAEGLDR